MTIAARRLSPLRNPFGAARRWSVALGLGAAALGAHAGVAWADPPGADALPVDVLTVTPADDADDQAEALTKALRDAVKAAPGWSLGTGDYSLEVLSIEMKCAKPPAPPDANCESRIADQIKVDRYIWGVLKKKGANVEGELHLWVRGKGTNKVDVTYSANLTEPNDDALKKVASDAIQQLTGGAPKGSAHIKVGNSGGQVFIDGQPVGALVAGEGTFALASGSHRVVVKAPGYADAEAQVAIKPNASSDVALTLVPVEPKSNLDMRRIGGYAGIGAGVAFGIVGVVSSLQVNSVRNDDKFTTYANQYVSSTDVCDAAANKQAPNPAKGERVLSGAATFDEAASMCSKASTFQVLQFVFYGLAAVSGGAGIYLLATSGGHQAPTTGLTVHPHVGLGNGGLDVAYRF